MIQALLLYFVIIPLIVVLCIAPFAGTRRTRQVKSWPAPPPLPPKPAWKPMNQILREQGFHHLVTVPKRKRPPIG